MAKKKASRKKATRKRAARRRPATPLGSKTGKRQGRKKVKKKARRIGRSVAADGRSNAVLQIQLPANAIVDNYDLKITANRAAFVKAKEAADLRPASDPSTLSVVVDFGVMRTVNAIKLPSGAAADSLKAWLGTKFDSRPIDLSTARTVIQRDSRGSVRLYSFPEIRTERLLVDLGDIDAEDEQEVLESVMDNMDLSLPELPAGLVLRINDGAPAWEHNASVQLATSNELNEDGWTEQGQRLVSITEALQEFGGDATNSGMLNLSLELTSNVPGKLAIEVAEKELRLLHRLSFDGREDLNLDFDEEGQRQFQLTPPQGVASGVSGVQLSFKGELDEERILPPLGPDSNGISELVLGNGRAACVRLDGIQELAEISAVRFPLETKSSSAEARVIIWEDQGGVPIKFMDDAVSEPETFNGDGEQWVTFPFAETIPVDPATPVWAALIVSRGEVVWKMAAGSADGSYPFRLGPPEGPWRALPAIFGAGTTLGTVGGRVRVAGYADEVSPLSPLLISIENGPEDQAVTLHDEALQLQLDIEPTETAAAGTGAQSDLQGKLLSIVSRSVGTVTMSEINVITGSS